MKSASRMILILTCIFSLTVAAAFGPSTAFAVKVEKKAKTGKVEKALPGSMAQKVPTVNAAFGDVSDMSDYDPANVVQPTGDTIRIAVVGSFSGPGTLNGQFYWTVVSWVAHDINKRGGLFVDGKMKRVQVLKADHMGKSDQCKKICERMALQEKVHVFWGTNGSHLMKIINDTANKYKIISVNAASLEDGLMDATNFSRYAFHAAFSTEQVGRGLAYYYGQVRKKEKKFYILCQDYGFGHAAAEGFKKGLKEYFPNGQIVGEDYHKLYLTDFAPYMEKIKASGAEVIFTADWTPDSGNLLKQGRHMRVNLPVANMYLAEPQMLHEVGVEGTKGLVHVNPWYSSPQFQSPAHIKIYKAWNNQWKKWKTAPYDGHTFEHFGYNFGPWTGVTYWLMSVIERAKSTDPEKIIATWENDSYRFVNGKIAKMRACDHKMIQDLSVIEFVPPEQQKVSMNIPPNYWFKGCSSYGPATIIPAAKVLPWMDKNLDRCKSKNHWGE